MSEQLTEQPTEKLRQDISSALEDSDDQAITQKLEDINVAKIADILDSTPSSQREFLWPNIADEHLGAVRHAGSVPRADGQKSPLS